RDSSVTGVQTCALPIWRALPVGRPGAGSVRGTPAVHRSSAYENVERSAPPGAVSDRSTAQYAISLAALNPILPAFVRDYFAVRRSEERRVGKGVRSTAL